MLPFEQEGGLASFLSGGGLAVSVVWCMGFEHLSRNIVGRTTMVKGRNRQDDMLFDLVFALQRTPPSARLLCA